MHEYVQVIPQFYLIPKYYIDFGLLVNMIFAQKHGKISLVVMHKFNVFYDVTS